MSSSEKYHTHSLLQKLLICIRSKFLDILIDMIIKVYNVYMCYQGFRHQHIDCVIKVLYRYTFWGWSLGEVQISMMLWSMNLWYTSMIDAFRNALVDYRYIWVAISVLDIHFMFFKVLNNTSCNWYHSMTIV